MPEIPVNKKIPQGEFSLNAAKPPQEVNITSPKVTLDHVHENVEHHRITPFSALCVYPQEIRFEDQKPDEEIILLVRRHFITNMPWIAIALISTIVFPIFLPFAPVIFPFLKLSIMTEVIFGLFYYLVIFGFILSNFSIWYFNATLITNTRIIDVDVTGILFRNVAETKLELIQDVSYTQIGVIPSFFDYGTVLVQTAAEQANFEIDHAPQPSEIIQIIGDLIGKKRRL